MILSLVPVKSLFHCQSSSQPSRRDWPVMLCKTHSWHGIWAWLCSSILLGYQKTTLFSEPLVSPIQMVPTKENDTLGWWPFWPLRDAQISSSFQLQFFPVLSLLISGSLVSRPPPVSPSFPIELKWAKKRKQQYLTQSSNLYSARAIMLSSSYNCISQNFPSGSFPAETSYLIKIKNVFKKNQLNYLIWKISFMPNQSTHVIVSIEGNILL